MQLRCKCGFVQNWTIHKDGLEAVVFTCDRCRRNKLRPAFVSIRVSSVRTLIVKRSSGRMVER